MVSWKAVRGGLQGGEREDEKACWVNGANPNFSGVQNAKN